MYQLTVYVFTCFTLCGTGMLELDGLLSNSTSMSSQSSLESDKNSPKSEEPKTEQVRWGLTVHYQKIISVLFPLFLRFQVEYYVKILIIDL